MFGATYDNDGRYMEFSIQELNSAGTLQDADGLAIGKDEVMRDLGAREELTPKQANEKLREAFSSHEPMMDAEEHSTDAISVMKRLK